MSIVLTVVPLLDTDEWYIRLWDFPRLQLLLLLALLLVAWLILGNRRRRRFWALGAALGLAIFWQATYAAAYLPIGPRQVRSAETCELGRSIALMSVNVYQENRDFASTLELVRSSDADVVLFLETDPAWARALAPLTKRYPYVSAAPLPNTYGMILMSRWPMDATVRYRMQPDIPSIDATVTMPSGDKVDLYALHPEPPLPGDDAGERDAELVMAGRDVRASGDASIVLGDLNDVAWSQTSRLFRKVSGTKDPRIGRGLYPTFNARYPLLRWPLDHMFVTPHWRVQAVNRLRDINSDHFPIYYRFCLTRHAERRMTAPRLEPEVRNEAIEEAVEGVQENRAEGNDAPVTEL